MTACSTASAQYVYTAIVRLTYKNRLLNFIDLCSTANISVFLLTAQRYGYYIHGQCVHGASDVSLATWYENFRAEEARFATFIHTFGGVVVRASHITAALVLGQVTMRVNG